MGDVVLFGKLSQPGVKACQTCKFRINDNLFPRDTYYWKCGVSGYFCSTESLPGEGNCGPEKLLWQPRPPDPPSFWQRLGDAIIARIRGDTHG